MIDLEREVSIRKAHSMLEPYRSNAYLHRKAVTAVAEVAANGGDIEGAAFRAALFLSMEESTQGDEWATRQRLTGKRPVRLTNRDKRGI
ncbi:hypothetical protein ACFY2K_26350 [Kitasatospora sp. NPDC001309]|uniref:hypothetical protein n=1 Tax=Kitasatospora sp. NPDC001309 TaxID=3364013 RepID=UPI003677982F